MAEKKIRISRARSGEVSVSPKEVTLSIDRQDSVTWESGTPFRVIEVAPLRKSKKRRAATGPFFRPFPRSGDPFRKRVNSGPAREGTRGTYKVSLQFVNRQKYDPIIIIDQ